MWKRKQFPDKSFRLSWGPTRNFCFSSLIWDRFKLIFNIRSSSLGNGPWDVYLHGSSFLERNNFFITVSARERIKQDWSEEKLWCSCNRASANSSENSKGIALQSPKLKQKGTKVQPLTRTSPWMWCPQGRERTRLFTLI